MISPNKRVIVKMSIPSTSLNVKYFQSRVEPLKGIKSKVKFGKIMDRKVH